ncbi:uncharacterized protein DNG_02884 [Cephalotrichum gorgonifer]|uniref:CREG-like beta-barrel domain-containing protein n=1 Tax=Cephalotrichum gorgonifer TaxID=2041049 RepID=A0AAE8MV73_9PEZI|nr:uncharacterized protein DNG_02884 [Cephalotrichum gorgonifer]
MKSLLTLALALPSALGSPALFPQADSAAAPPPAGHRIPTSYESAVMGRRILALSKLADFSTTFPTSSSSSESEDEATSLGRRPEGLAGLPINMMDYIAECEDSGNPTVLAINIATTFRNAAAGSNVSVSLRWTPPYPPAHRIPLSLWGRLSEAIFGPGEDSAPPDTVPYSAANLPRMSLIGYFEPIEPAGVPGLELAACFVAKHPDAKYWLPGNAIHKSSWARLVVTQVYWVGGFGDRAYIGWIPIEEWQSVTKEEWSSITLPGEKKGWREWSAVEGSMEPDL